MKILKYKKIKNGMYQLFFDNDNNIDLHEEIILKYNLLIKKEVNSKELDKMVDENKKYLGYNLAIKYLAKKMRSTKEIKEYLLNNNIDNKTTDEIIELLKKENYLDELMFSKAFINDKILLSNDGPHKISNKLSELGISKDIIDNTITIFTYDIQKEKVEKIVNKQKNINKNKSNYVLKNKIIDYLYNLGYDRELINSVIDNISFNQDSDIAKKEYNKIYNKLSKKYSGNELEYRVKQKMYALGFRDFDI